MTTFVRVRQDGVGEWSQSIDIPLRDGQEWLRDEPATNAQGLPLPPVPDDSHLDGAEPRARTEPPRAVDLAPAPDGEPAPPDALTDTPTPSRRRRAHEES